MPFLGELPIYPVEPVQKGRPSDKSGLSWRVVSSQDAKTIEKCPRVNIIVSFGRGWSLFKVGLSGRFDCIYVKVAN